MAILNPDGEPLHPDGERPVDPAEETRPSDPGPDHPVEPPIGDPAENDPSRENPTRGADPDVAPDEPLREGDI